MPALNELMNSLTAELDATTALLNRGEEDNWSRGLVRISNVLKAGNTDAVRDLLSIFGGMGSFNDLVIYPPGDAEHNHEEMCGMNDALAAHRRTLYTLAKDIRLML